MADDQSLYSGGAKIYAIDTRRINLTPGDQDKGSITLVNDQNNGRVLDREIDSKLAGLLEAYVAESGRSINVNSTIRDRDSDRKRSPHYTGFGVDINKIDGKPVTANEPLVGEFVDFMKSREEPFQIIGPIGGFEMINGSFTRKRQLEKGHDTHIHLGTRPNGR